MLRRDDGERTEFITLSLWDSENAIRAFAGDDIEALWRMEHERTGSVQAGYSSLRHVRGSSGCAFGVRSSRKL
jgi:heme-degrading monooxygenase HmoA